MKIVSAGGIYPGKQKPEVLFQALRELIDEGEIKESDYNVEIYSEVEPWLAKEIEAWGLGAVVKQCGRVPHEEMLRVEREADILWLMKWDSIIRGDGWFWKLLDRIFIGKHMVEYHKRYEENFVGKPETGVIGLKFYEYLGLRNYNILATGGCVDEVSKILAETWTGFDCLTVESVKTFLVSKLNDGYWIP